MDGIQAREPQTGRVTFAELSVVALLYDVEVKGRALPQGAHGTVVTPYPCGLGYEVEFEEPFHAVVTLDVTDLTA
jgi:hypothetical protein